MADKIPKVKHLIGTNKVVTLEDVYGDISQITGIQKIDDSVTLPADYDTYKSPNTLSSLGVIRRAKVTLSTKKIRIIYIIAANCPKIGSLVGQQYIKDSGVTITSACFSQKYTFR